MKSTMLLIVIIISLTLTVSLSAQDFLFYRIEDVSQINLAGFDAKLKKEVTEHEAVIVLLPRDRNNIYRKTLTAENNDDIRTMLIYIIQIKGKDIAVNTKIFDEEINSTLVGLKNKYGPSFRYTVISYTKFNLPKVENPSQNMIDEGKIAKEENPIKLEDETSPSGALFLAVILFIAFLIVVWMLKELFRVISYKRKKGDSNVLHIYNNMPQSILSSYEKEKNDFFKGHQSKVISILILTALVLPGNQMQSFAQTTKYNFYVDNTIRKEYRNEVKTIVLQAARFNTHFFLFGDSVRSIGYLKSNFAELDTIFSRITFKDRKTSFSSLIDHAKKRKGICFIITDGRPDYFTEDIPNFYYPRKDSLRDTTKTAQLHSKASKQSDFKKILSVINNNIVSVISIIFLATLFVFLLIRKKKSKTVIKPLRHIIFKDSEDGQVKTFNNIIKVSSKRSSLFNDVYYDPGSSDLEIKIDNEDVLISTIKLNERGT